MPALPPEVRRDLDKAISTARTGARSLAEAAARSALERLGVEATEAPPGLSPELRALRTALRERAKALGGGVRTLGIPLLVEEIAYEQWHRMLFARFLAENDLLLHPEGAPVSLADVRELAAEEGERDPWVLASRYAAAMLPGIFRADDPANRVAFAREDRSRLEGVLEGLPASTFTADDALGWVYQFWQSEQKGEVNKKRDKIGGADLPAVTQLFTEHYMVRFLLENSLGAWWASRHPDSPLLQEWDYLRFRDDDTPAVGTFEGWPTRVAEVTVMDPCCGSGHFLTAAADMLRKMRTEEDGLSPAQAAVAVLRDNLFGLELDARCLQLAAFNLALDAWKAGGYQPLPIPNLACTGIAIKGQRADWHRLAGGDSNMANALDRLYDFFQNAPELGSLIDPRAAAGDGLWAVDADELLSRLDRALARETAADPAAAVFGAAAAGTAKAAQLLSRRYWLIATNPPFLSLKKLDDPARVYAEHVAPEAGDELAAVVALVSIGRLFRGGATAFVLPQTLTFLASYESFRRAMLSQSRWQMLARLGAGAFSSVSGEVVKVVLSIAASAAAPDADSSLIVVDASLSAGAPAKAHALRQIDLAQVSQRQIRERNGARISFGATSTSDDLRRHAESIEGTSTGDGSRYLRAFWEVSLPADRWARIQGPIGPTGIGMESVMLWEHGAGSLARSSGARIRGQSAWGRSGILVSRMGSFRYAPYAGGFFDKSCVVVTPREPMALPAVAAFLLSGEFEAGVRAIDTKIGAATGTVLDVPFDLEHWTKVAAYRYPDGLPDPRSDDPTQWLFKGNVVSSEAPLQVAVARLLGYRWPDQEPDVLDAFADADGLVPLVSVSGERAAAERLRGLLARVYGDAWSPALLDRFLAEAGSPGATLETWLRDDFFAQHVKLFAQRPFIWHVWDGRKDGFSVLCHYHHLDRARLERLTYTLLGDWIERQKAARDEPGAEGRLSAAVGLQQRLAAIAVGEAPLDIYVRWKTLAEQPIGWEPDLDDGVRLNIRPFVTAGVLRAKVNVKWDKDRGKNPDGSERINDLHPTLAEKRAARAAAGRG